MNILIVEDDMVSRTLLIRVLSTYGVCDVAVDGEEALHAFRSALERGSPYTLVCLDIELPKLNGQEVLKGIRGEEETRRISPINWSKVIMVTGTSDPKDMFTSFKSGCEAFISKPLDISKLKKELIGLKLITE